MPSLKLPHGHPYPLCFRASPEASTGHKPLSAAHSDMNKKRRRSITSTLGLSKLFSALSHASRPRLGTSRSYSVEQLQPSLLAPQASTSKVKRAPSLQILHLVSPGAWAIGCGPSSAVYWNAGVQDRELGAAAVLPADAQGLGSLCVQYSLILFFHPPPAAFFLPLP